MNTKTFFLIIVFSAMSLCTLFAQHRVALHHNGATTIFAGINPFNSAYLAAQTGDTIYLPDGSLLFPTNINKGLVIIGAGHNPDSTTATFKTILNGSLNLLDSADNLYLEGIEINGSITFANNEPVNNVVISRCLINGDIVYNGNRTTPCQGNTIKQCFIYGVINLANADNITISNNCIGQQINNGYNSSILNNILYYNHINSYFTCDYTLINNFYGSFVANNIFMRGNCSNLIHAGTASNIFSNNVFRAAVVDVGSNTFTGNYFNVLVDTIMVNNTVAPTLSWYARDYHLKANLAATYIGNDGKVVGLYGGLFPFKDGMLPRNPHIQFKHISTQTNNVGEINVEIRVKAQTE